MAEDRWAGTSWRIAAIDDEPLRGRATVAFDDEGRVAGQAVVNRYFGGYTAEGATVTFSALGSTMMAGAPEAMAEEQKVLRALEGILEVVADGPHDDGSAEAAVTLRGTATLRLVAAAAGEPGPSV